VTGIIAGVEHHFAAPLQIFPKLPNDVSRFVASDERTTAFSGPGEIGTKLRLLAIDGAQLFAK
jgi:hypothetical protein